MIQDKLRLTPPADSRLMGETGRAIDLFLYHRAASDAARNLVYAQAESALAFPYDDRLDNGSGLWQGEFWGKWMLSAVLAAEYTRSDSLKAFVRDAALRVAATARADGYIGSYRNAEAMLENREAAVWAEGCNWSVWCRKYTLWGLLEAYRLTGEERTLRAAAGMADHLIASLERQGLALGRTGCVVGLASCSILKPLLLLYRYTGGEPYLRLAREICDAWENNPSQPPAILANALQGRPVHAWYPDPQQWAKAYEMTSCLEGLVEMYRVTGEGKYLQAVVTLRDLIAERELNPLRSVGYIDRFNRGADRLNAMSEPCDAIHWCRLNLALLCVTGEPKYANAYADCFYNAILASANPEGTWGPCRMRSSYRHIYAWEQSEFHLNHCCVNNLPRAFVDTASFAVMQGEEGVYVHLYDAGQYRLKDVQGQAVCVTVRGHFLDSGKAAVAIDVAGAEPLPVHLLFPEWGPGTMIRRNGVLLPGGRPGAYLDAAADPGTTTTFALDFDMNPRLTYPKANGLLNDPDLRPGNERFAHFGGAHDIPETAAYHTPQHCVFWGPLLLARDIRLGYSLSELFTQSAVADDSPCAIVPEGKAPGFRHTYRVTLRDCQGAERTCRMCDFPSAGQTYDPDTSAFTIYI